MNRIRCVCLLSFAVAVASAVPASAQMPRASGPFTGLFGGLSTSRHVLDARGSLFGAYQDAFLPEEAVAIDPALDVSTAFHGASAGLQYVYNRTARGTNLFFGGQGTVSRFSQRPDEFPYSFTADGGVSTPLGQRATFTASGNANYSPYYGFPSFEAGFTPNSVFGQDPALVGQPGYRGVLYEPTVVYGAGAAVSYQLAQNTTFTADTDWHSTELLDDDQYDTRSYQAGAVVRQQLTQYIGVRGGYHRQVSSSNFPGSERIVSNNFDLGLDANYGRALELSPSTSVGFGASTSLYNSNGDTHFRVNGFASLNHEMGRTWVASAGYARDGGYQLGFTDIVLSDRVYASLSGLVFSRLSSRSGLTWERGEVGFDSATSYQTTSATTGLTYGLTSLLGLYAQYSYFYYRVPPTAVTLPFYERYSRQIVSGGVTLYVPIVNTGRGIRDSR